MTGRPDVLAHARTWLFVPGDRPDRFARAHRAGADVVVVDLEDAVAPADRDQARANLVRAVGVEGRRPVVVRVNSTPSPQQRPDLDAVEALADRLDGVMLPKVEQPDEIHRLERTTGLPVVGLVETARGVENLGAVAGAEGLVRLGLGAIDLGLDLGVAAESTGGPIDHSRVRLVLTSRAAGLPGPIESPCPVLRDLTVIAAHARRARELGMSGVLCVHPNQVPVVAEEFRSSPQEVERARALLRMAETAGRGALQDGGRMIDAPVLERARRVLAEADRQQ